MIANIYGNRASQFLQSLEIEMRNSLPLIPSHQTEEAMIFSACNENSKKIRATLAFLCHSTDEFSIEPFAAAVEFIHSYTLIHDDLPCMDNADQRRNKPSCHKKFSESSAILAGDALLTLALRKIAYSYPTICSKLIVTLCDAIGHSGLIAGQTLDLAIAKSQASTDKIINIHVLKTAIFFQAICECAGIISNAKDHDIELLKLYGLNFGKIFQIADDVQDTCSGEQNNIFIHYDLEKIRLIVFKLQNEAKEAISKCTLPDKTELIKLVDYISNF